MNQPQPIADKNLFDRSTVDKGTLVDQVIGRIEQDMHNGRFPAGTFMGTQADLCAAYGVSTPVFFQATRVLIHRGLVELRKGNGGGLFAVDNSINQVGKRMATYLECIGVDFADAAPVSRLLQELCVRLATAALTLESAVRIRAITQQVADATDHFERGHLLSSMFQQFAEASGNEVLALLYRVITDVMLDVSIADTSVADTVVPQAVIRDLGIQLGDAVIAADHEQTARNYLQFRDALLRWQMELSLERDVTAPLPSFVDRNAESGKLPERLAAHILREIRQLGWPIGEKLGNEADLLARYGVARATFRQAIRLLEEYSAVETRRGPKGGLLIASPSADVINATAMALLHRRHATRAMAREILMPLMTLAIEIALARGANVRMALIECCNVRATDSRVLLGKLTTAILRGGNVKVLTLFVQLLGNFEDSGQPAHENFDTVHFSILLDAFKTALTADDRSLARCIITEIVRKFGVGATSTLI